MAIDYTIRLGDIVSFFGFAGGGLAVIFLMKSDIRALGIRLGFLEDKAENSDRKLDAQSAEIAKFGELLVVMGRYDERLLGFQRQYESQQKLIEHLQQTIEDFRHGRGFIKERTQGT